VRYKMHRTNYEVIKDFLELESEDPMAFKSSTKKLYALSLKGLSKEKDRDIQITLTDIQALKNPNQEYCAWKEKYNSYDAIEYGKFLANKDKFATLLKRMRGILNGGKKKNDKRLKKRMTRIYDDIKKVCKTYKLSPKNYREFYLALRAGFFAYKEAIINIRDRLRPKLYDSIPPDLSITKNGKTYKIKDLYKKLKTNNSKIYYKLDSKNFSKEELRDIQLKIYPHIFQIIYNTIRV